MRKCVITDGQGTRAVILPEKGATVISLQKDGKEFLYCDWENLNSPERPRCGIPFLFPIFGRLTEGAYTWEGTKYEMAIHGFAHTSAWQVVEHREDFLSLALEADDLTLSQYPFRFRVTLEFALRSGVLTIGQTYENLDEKPIPYNFGFHPYFLTKKPENIQVEATAKTFWDFTAGAKEFGHGTVSVTLPEDAPETGAVFMGARDAVILRNAAEGKQLTMEFDENFHTIVLWHQAEKPFLCVEPVNGTADGLNKGIYLTLNPGEIKRALVSFRAD